MNLRIRGRLVAATAVFLLAGGAAAQESGVKRIQHYRDTYPREDFPTLSAGFLSFTPDTEWDVDFARLHAFLAEQVAWDSNVFGRSSDVESDTLFLTSPGFLAEKFVGDHRIALSYAPTWKAYARNSDLDTWDHSLDADVRLDFLDSYLRFTDRFTKAQDPRDIRYGTLTDRKENRAHLEYGALDGDIGYGAALTNRILRYGGDLSDSQDLMENSATAFVWWDYHPDYSFVGEYEFMLRTYREDILNNSAAHTVRIGVEGSPKEEISYVAKLGVVFLNAHRNGTLDDDSDLVDAVGEASLDAELDLDVRASVSFVHRPEYSSSANYQKTDRGTVSLAWAIDPLYLGLRASIYAERADPSRGPALGYLGAGLALDYAVNRWMKAGVGYEARRRTGGDGGDYTTHRVFLQVAVFF